MKPLSKLLPLARGLRGLMLLALTISLLAQALTVAVPLLAGQMVKQAIELHRVRALPWLTLEVMALFAARGALNWTEIYLGSRVGQVISCRLREVVYTHLLQLRFSFFDRTRTGQLLSRLTSDLEPINGFVRWGMRMTIRNTALLLFSFALALRIDALLAWIGIGSMPLIAVTAWAVGARIRPAFERAREQLGVVTSRLQDNLQGIRVVKTYVQEGREIERFTAESNRLRDESYEAARIDAVYYPLTGFWSGLATIVVLYAGGMRVIEGRLTFDQYVTFSLLVMQLIIPMRLLGYMLSVGQRAAAACSRIYAILEDRRDIEPLAQLQATDAEPSEDGRALRLGTAKARKDAKARNPAFEPRRHEEHEVRTEGIDGIEPARLLPPAPLLRRFVSFVSSWFQSDFALSRPFALSQFPAEAVNGEGQASENGAAAPVLRGAVRFEGVSFAYPGSVDARGGEILHGIDLEVAAGEVIGIVGTTGSGKSTLVSLIPAFYHATRGRVLIDGQDVTRLDPDALRRQIGFVFQEPFLFPGTLRENLLFGRPEATEAEMIAAARDAAIHDFIESLELGYDTVVGERGLTLSGGQQQRMTIARTLLMDPRILILDDYTSSVDTYTEHLIQTALARLMRGRTTFIITPRAAPLMAADRVVVMEDGRILEVGPPAELARRPGNLFYELLELQGSQQLAGTAGDAHAGRAVTEHA